MHNNINFNIDNETFQKILEKKNEMGFSNKGWNEWFHELFNNENRNTSSITTIEKTLQTVHFEKFYDLWIQNFAINLKNIWRENSARNLIPEQGKAKKYSIIIGRGPSLKKNGHLQMLAKSKYDGNIICTDGILIDALKSGVTPDLFKNFFVVTIDSTEHIFDHYDDPIINQYGSKIKGIFSTTIFPRVYERARKAGITPYWLHTLFDYDKGKSSFNYISNVMTKNKKHEKGLPAIQTGGNVGTSSWVVSWSILHSKFVVLLGLDQGYPTDLPLEKIGYGTHKFPSRIKKNKKILEQAYPIIYNPDFNCHVRQDPIFQYYSNAFKQFIQKTSKQVNTINATEGGALFGPGITSMRFHEFLKKFVK